VTGASILKSAKLASLCAGEIICHFGARPQLNLKDFIAKVI